MISSGSSLSYNHLVYNVLRQCRVSMVQLEVLLVQHARVGVLLCEQPITTHRRRLGRCLSRRFEGDGDRWSAQRAPSLNTCTPQSSVVTGSILSSPRSTSVRTEYILSQAGASSSLLEPTSRYTATRQKTTVVDYHQRSSPLFKAAPMLWCHESASTGGGYGG